MMILFTFTGSSRIAVTTILLALFIISVTTTRASTKTTTTTTNPTTTTNRPTVGFGTAALGEDGYNIVTIALQNGFRIFDTAEADWWYNQSAVGDALRTYFTSIVVQNNQQRCQIEYGSSSNDSSSSSNSAGSGAEQQDDCTNVPTTNLITADDLYTICEVENVLITTKIGPWDLVSEERIRSNAATSRTTLVGFCDGSTNKKYPLDLYLIHAPTCWQGWHPRCNGIKNNMLLSLRDAWRAMEQIVAIDQSANRIGLSNVSPNELRDIIQFVQERAQTKNNHRGGSSSDDYPRMPDAVQIYSDPLEPAIEMRKLCEQYNIEFISYSTLGTQHSMRSGKNPVLTHPTVVRLATHYNRSTAEIVLSWAIQNNMSIIPRSTNPLHIQQLARLLPKSSDKNGTPTQGFLSDADLELMNAIHTTWSTTS